MLYPRIGIALVAVLYSLWLFKVELAALAAEMAQPHRLSLIDDAVPFSQHSVASFAMLQLHWILSDSCAGFRQLCLLYAHSLKAWENNNRQLQTLHKKSLRQHRSLRRHY